MSSLLIFALCLIQVQVQASDWLDRTVRVDLITHQQDIDRQYKTFDQMAIRSTDSNATNGQYPWTVMTAAWAIQGKFGMGNICTSTIISKDFLLSDLRCAGQE